MVAHSWDLHPGTDGATHVREIEQTLTSYKGFQQVLTASEGVEQALLA